jgi:hypothetical protein
MNNKSVSLRSLMLCIQTCLCNTSIGIDLVSHGIMLDCILNSKLYVSNNSSIIKPSNE